MIPTKKSNERTITHEEFDIDFLNPLMFIGIYLALVIIGIAALIVSLIPVLNLYVAENTLTITQKWKNPFMTTHKYKLQKNGTLKRIHDEREE